MRRRRRIGVRGASGVSFGVTILAIVLYLGLQYLLIKECSDRGGDWVLSHYRPVLNEDCVEYEDEYGNEWEECESYWSKEAVYACSIDLPIGHPARTVQYPDDQPPGPFK